MQCCWTGSKYQTSYELLPWDTPEHTGSDAPSPGAVPLHGGALLFYFLHKTPRNTVLAESTGALILIPRHLGQSAVFLLFSIGFGMG